MIEKLENSNVKIANKIFIVFQSSYKIEAQLIGTLSFPPLKRSIDDIKNSNTIFYGFSENDNLAGVIEVELEGKRLGINSLTVHPDYFRKGIANKLISYVLERNDFIEAVVETATVNEPAIKLYEKHGFIEFKRWTPSHGIKKLAMSTNRSNLKNES